MIISKEHKYIFVAVPKTGTTSIQKFLLENDTTAKKNSVVINENIYIFKEHYTAKKIREILGVEYSNFKVFGFMRDPYSRLVSSYHFYKNGEPLTINNKNPWPVYIRILFARIFPFKVWVLLYPYKSNIEYLTNTNGNKIVNYIGRFENLNEDLKNIIDIIGLNFDTSKLQHINKSKHDYKEKYFKSKIFKKLVQMKIKRDINFYDQYSSDISF